jgi:hypothetical protein
MKFKFKNRYGSEYTFTRTDEGILWEGDFNYCRFAWPNDYTKAYEAYCKDCSDIQVEPIPLDDFKIKIHSAAYDDDGNWMTSDIHKHYASLVHSDTSSICMVDPPGGPYICENMELRILNRDLDGMIVDSFEVKQNGYLIKVK